jgi:hypothetical protein
VRCTIKVLAVAALVAVMMVASVSPVLAAKVRGGVLLQTEQPCDASSEARNVSGSHLTEIPDDPEQNPEGRAPGCWVLLPPNANPGD